MHFQFHRRRLHVRRGHRILVVRCAHVWLHGLSSTCVLPCRSLVCLYLPSAFLSDNAASPQIELQRLCCRQLRITRHLTVQHHGARRVHGILAAAHATRSSLAAAAAPLALLTSMWFTLLLSRCTFLDILRFSGAGIASSRFCGKGFSERVRTSHGRYRVDLRFGHTSYADG